MFFTVKKEETGAINLFRKNCTYHGLEIKLSLKALAALKLAVDAQFKGEPPAMNERDLHTLSRRGFIREEPDGLIIVTQAGLHIAALAEAGLLISFTKATKERVNVEAK